MARFWVWTWRAGAMSAVAAPITWPYLRTISPARMARVATLWPLGIASAAATPSPATCSPGARRRIATTTLSAGLRRRAFGAAVIEISA